MVCNVTYIGLLSGSSSVSEQRLRTPDMAMKGPDRPDPLIVKQVLRLLAVWNLQPEEMFIEFESPAFLWAFFLYWVPTKNLKKIGKLLVRPKLLKNSYGHKFADLLDAGMTPQQAKGAGFQVRDFRDRGLPLDQFQYVFSISSLLYHGCRIDELLAFETRCGDLIQKGSERLSSQDCPQDEKKEWTKVFIHFKQSRNLGELIKQCPVETWKDIFSIQELLQAGKKLSEFLHVYPFESVEAAGFLVKDAVATAETCVYQKLKEAGKSAQEVFQAINDLQPEAFEVAREDFFTDGAYTLSEKLQAGMPILMLEDGPDAKQFKDAKCTADELKAVGFDPQFLACAYTCEELRAAGFTFFAVKDAFTEKALAEAGFPAQEFNQHGITVKLLQADGCTAAQLKTLGFSASELRDAYTEVQLASAGYSAGELQQVGCQASSLMSSYTTEEIINAGFSPESLKAAGIIGVWLRKLAVKRLKEAKFTAKELKDSGFTRGELELCYPAPQLREAGFHVQPKKWTPSHGMMCHPNRRGK